MSSSCGSREDASAFFITNAQNIFSSFVRSIMRWIFVSNFDHILYMRRSVHLLIAKLLLESVCPLLTDSNSPTAIGSHIIVLIGNSGAVSLGAARTVVVNGHHCFHVGCAFARASTSNNADSSSAAAVVLLRVTCLGRLPWNESRFYV